MGTVLTTLGLPSWQGHCPGTGLGLGTPPGLRAGHGDTARTRGWAWGHRPGTGLGMGTPPGHCSTQAGGAWLPLWGLWQKLRLPWPLVLALLCWIPGDSEISAGLRDSVVAESPSGTPSLHQHRWQQGHLSDCGHGCHSWSSISIHRACRVTRTHHPKPRALSTLWGQPHRGSWCRDRSHPCPWVCNS